MADESDATVSEKDGTEEVETQETNDKQTTSTDDEKDGKKEKTFTQSQLNKIIEKRLADAKKQFEKDKDLSESEKLKADNERLQKELNERNAFDDFDSFFGKKGVKNTRGLFRAMKGELSFDDKGKLENLKDLLEDAKADFPEFFESVKGDADGKKGKDGDGKTVSFSDRIRRGFGR
jgi:hypothetical protein